MHRYLQYSPRSAPGEGVLDVIPGLIGLGDGQPDGLGWFVFTDQAKQKLYDLAIEHARCGDWMPEIGQLYKNIEEELHSGLVVKGNTIAEPAAGLGAPADVPEKTLTDYESYCAAPLRPNGKSSPPTGSP